MDKKTVLVIDDEVDLVDVIKYEFEAMGFNVMTAHDGVEGLKVLKNIKPSLIILDMNMPNMGGIEFYKNILQADGNPVSPVLVLTARGQLNDLFSDFNVADFMTKPFEIADLIEKSKAIINQ